MKRPRALYERGPVLRGGSGVDGNFAQVTRAIRIAGDNDSSRLPADLILGPTARVQEFFLAPTATTMLGHLLRPVGIVHRGAFEPIPSVPVFTHCLSPSVLVDGRKN